MNTKADSSSTPFSGNIEIKPQVVFSLALDAVLSTYGVVGIASRYTGFDTTIRDAHRGLDVKLCNVEDGSTTVSVTVHVIVEYGVRISEVISSLQEQIAYGIQHNTGYCVDSVNIHVSGLHVTHED